MVMVVMLPIPDHTMEVLDTLERGLLNPVTAVVTAVVMADVLMVDTAADAAMVDTAVDVAMVDTPKDTLGVTVAPAMVDAVMAVMVEEAMAVMVDTMDKKSDFRIKSLVV